MIGHPVRHSLSPVIHNAAFAAVGLDWVYLAFDVAPGEAAAALDGVRSLGVEGLNVTMPHKAAVAAAVDELTPTAAALGAVNCVVRDGRRLVGHNTDGGGFLDALELETGFVAEGSRCAVVGAGGAARAVVRALAEAGAAAVGVANRTPEKAAATAELACGVGSVVVPDELGGFDLVVNATSVGMKGTPGAGQVPFDPSVLQAGQIVADIVYEPTDTPLVVAARRRGVVAVHGVGMLVHQAARSFELWTGHAAPVAEVRAAVERALLGDTG